MKNLVEGQKGHGAKPLGIIHRGWRKISRPTIGKGGFFDWEKGYDVRDKIGPIKIKDQGQSFSCAGQSAAYFLEIQRRLQGINEGAISAKSIYAPIAAVGGGADLNSLVSQISFRGAELEAKVPSYDIDGLPLPEYLMTEKSWETPNVITDMLTRAGYTPYNVPTDIDSAASTIAAYGAVIFTIKGQNNGTWLNPVPMPPSKSNSNPYWYHYICGIGGKIVNEQKAIIDLQSWGEDTGDKGIQFLNEDYFKNKGILNVEAWIHDSQIAPLPDNHNIWAEILRWFRSQWGLSVA